MEQAGRKNLKKVLIITYYWPPSGGSGVQRWLYFARYLSEFGFEPIVLTVDVSKSSYKFTDSSLERIAKGIKVFRTKTLEPLKLYSFIISRDPSKGIPQGFAGEERPGIFKKVSRFIRGNFFIPDARKGWIPFVTKRAEELIRQFDIPMIITTGPPHSTHLAGLRLKRSNNIKWIADFRDPWTEIYYNKDLYRTPIAEKRDLTLETNVLKTADAITTVGPTLRELLLKKIPERKEKVKVIFNGYDHELFDARNAQRQSKFVISHIGLLGARQPITSFLKALLRLCEEHDAAASLQIDLLGKISPEHVREIKATLPEVALKITEYVPHQQAVRQMFDSELLLNSLPISENSKLIVSGKLMEYIASGRAILALGDPDGDAARLMNELAFAEVFSRTDANGIYKYLEKIYLRWVEGKTTIRESVQIDKYSRRNLTREIAQVMDETLSQ